MKLALPSRYIYFKFIVVGLVLLALPIVSLSQTFPFQLPELPAGKKVTIYYNVVVNDPLDPGTTSMIGEHDTVFYGPGKFLLSNDPATVAPGDITLTPAAQFVCDSFNGLVYVDSSATDGNNDGTSWANAFTDLQDALLARLVCEPNIDSILVAKGTYYPTSDPMNRDSSFKIPDGVVVLGGFPSGGGGLDQRDWNCNETILSGDIDGDGAIAGNSLHVVWTKNVSSATIVDGFVITGGNATGGSLPDQAGGGWYNDGSGSGNASNPTIRNCVFLENTSSDFGGAMFNNGLSGESSPILMNCMFLGNSSLVSGGAIFNHGLFGISSPVLVNCVLSGNTALNGGGVFNNGVVGASSPELINCVFSGNRANEGGAMYNLGSGGLSSPGVVNSIFNNNAAPNGPVFFNADASPTIQNSLFGVDFTTVNHNNSVADNGNNKFTMDPLFMSAPPASAAPTTAGNFRILSGSPAIDMGDNGSNSAMEDLDGLSRVYNGTIDMGAYESRPYCMPDTVYLDANGEGIVSLEALNLVGELPEFQGCELDTIIDAQPMVTCSDTAIFYTLYLIKGLNSANPDTIIQCPDTIWVLDTMAPMIDMISMDLAVNEDCMAVMPDLSPYVSDNCSIDTIIQNPEAGMPLGPPGSMVMVTLYARDSSGNESSVMFDFEVVEVAPTEPLNCAAIISPSILPDGTIGVLVSEIAPNATCLPVHDVQVLNQWGGVIWSGQGLRGSDFILDGFNLCAFLGKTLEVQITNGLGTCALVLNLDKNESLVFSSGLQSNGDPNISEGKINVYCGQVPGTSQYVPTVVDLCTDKSYTASVQPDWIMPIPCDEASDTAEIIFRTWEVYDKEGNLSTLTDTIVVFRLPKLTPDAFVNSAEDSFYCELSAVPYEGEAVKRYASWKQPIGLHDYELPYAKLGGVTYEIPVTIIEAGIVNAFTQGPKVYQAYLDCVILKKADGTEVTIGDIVSGDYINDLIATATPQQLTYGFLQALIELNENPLKILFETLVLEFYPYLLLQEGDWILSEGGNYEKVTSDWFYNGHGTSPFWFTGGWPSIYGSGDCVSFCDVGSGQDFDCIRIQVPQLNIDTGFDPQICDTICLPTGVHCGITIIQDPPEVGDWTSSSMTGLCPQTRGRDSWITQTCWALTPNNCAGEEVVPDVVVDYEETSKSVKVHLSQWQTLVDTLGPIFDFCYPLESFPSGSPGPTGPMGQTGLPDLNGLASSDALFAVNHMEYLLQAIRQGQQPEMARDWERKNPTTYRVSSYNCQAEVLVPSVRLIDNCSGVHSVKAMVDGIGGTRAVALELTGTEIKILANGDSCIIYTYAHTQDPIRIPFEDCDGEPIEIRYEAADHCWNQSTWSKFIRIIDDVAPTVVLNRNLNVNLTDKIAWARATSFDEGSWDNCAIDLRLGRRIDWWTDSAMVNLCEDNAAHAPYDNWVDLLSDLGVDRGQASTAVSGGLVTMEDFNSQYSVEDLTSVLNDGEVEQYYFHQIQWLWEDEALCGEKIVHAWIYSIASIIAAHCSAVDEHGNTLEVRDLETIFDRLTSTAGYGQELAYLGGGWSKEVPFKCGDACEEVPVELMVMDPCCNFAIGSSSAFVNDQTTAKLVKRLPDLEISCEAYNGFYKDLVEQAAALGAFGSVDDDTGVFTAIDSAFGRYIKTWVDNQNRPMDSAGNLLSETELNFDYHNIYCEEKSETEKIAVERHDGTIDWVDQVRKVSYLDTTTSVGSNGIVGINCSAICVQDVWVDLDECGQGTITRRFFIAGGCDEDQTPELMLEQIIQVAPACGLRQSMFDLPTNVGTKDEPICLPQGLSEDYLPDTIGAVKLKPDFESGLCTSIAIGKTIKELDVSGSDMTKYEIIWSVIDWCADHNSSTRSFTHTQEVLAIIDMECEVDSGTGDGGVSLISGRIMTELQSPVKDVEVKAVLAQENPLQIVTSGDGAFRFSIDQGSPVSIIPRKNTGFSEGISTADLIDIQRHILQKKALDSRYQRMAADVNGNDQIDGLDVLELRKVVLNPGSVFPNNTSWRFYDKATDKEIFVTNGLTVDQEIEFTAVKIGDVNRSSDPANPNRSPNGQLRLNIADKTLKGGEIYRIDVRSENFEDIRGIQYTLDYADDIVSIQSIEPGALKVTSDNYMNYMEAASAGSMAHNGLLTFSWNETEGVSTAAEVVLFTIVVKAKRAAALRDALSLNDRVTPTKAYAENGEYKDVALHFDGDEGGFALYQNTPNPYEGETVIGFVLPYSTVATMTIYDVTGRMIQRIEGSFEAGYNEVRVRSIDLGTTGVLYYQLDTDKYTATKKMIVLE